MCLRIITLSYSQYDFTQSISARHVWTFCWDTWVLLFKCMGVVNPIILNWFHFVCITFVFCFYFPVCLWMFSRARKPQVSWQSRSKQFMQFLQQKPTHIFNCNFKNCFAFRFHRVSSSRSFLQKKIFILTECFKVVGCCWLKVSQTSFSFVLSYSSSY